MRLVNFKHHDGDEIWIDVEKIVWIKPHSCGRHRGQGGIDGGVDVCLQGQTYVALQGSIVAIVNAILRANEHVIQREHA